jgi:thiamine kinase-like enzyme
MTATPLDEVLALVPELAGPERDVTTLPGGLTNANHRVRTAHGCFVVRCWSDDTGLLAIDRDHEHANSVRAAEAGVGARVVAYLPERNAMVFEFLDGVTLRAADLADGERLRQAAAVCRRLHGAQRFDGDFDMFALAERYQAIVEERGFRLPPRFASFAPQVEELRGALAVRAGPTVPCNNDLLAENFIACRDGLRIIDYEYAGNNDPAFELGNIWSEASLPPERLAELVDAYHGRHLRHAVARARLWGIMSKYGWTLWASIQGGVSTLDFDFWAWGMEKYERAVAEFDDTRTFAHLLAEAQRPD